MPLILSTLLLAASVKTTVGHGVRIPEPDPGHRAWGPQPPVAPISPKLMPETGESIPIDFPLIGPCHYKRSYNLDYGGYRHSGIDIVAPKMTPIVAPFSGVIGFKRESYWIYGDNGWVTLGTHLNDDSTRGHDHKGDKDMMFAPYLRPYQHVAAGEFLGYVGMSGDATGPHLHFELYAPGKGSTMSRIRDPFKSLQMATKISRPTSLISAQTLVPRGDNVSLYGCVRGWKAKSRTLTLLVVQKENANRKMTVAVYPHYVKVKLSDDAILDMGGEGALGALRPTTVIGIESKYSGRASHYFGVKASSIIDTTVSLEPTKVFG